MFRANRGGLSVLPQICRGLVAGVLLGVPMTLLVAIVSLRWSVLVHLDHRTVIAATDVTRAHPGLRTALIGWQRAFHPLVVYTMAIPVAVLAWSRGLRARTAWAAATMLVGWNLAFQIKLVVRRDRPVIVDPVAHSPGWSFPSGHAVNTTLMLTTCVLLVWPLVRRRWVRIGLVVGAAALVALTATDRIFLGAHFPTDVAAGILLGLTFSGASYLGFTHTRRRSSVAQS